MYDELIKDLRESAPKALSEADFDFVEGWLKEAADAIEERCQQVDKFAEEAARLYAKQPKWISVAERLPEDDDKRFLVCAKRFNGEPYMHICYHAKNLHEFDEYDFPTENRPGWYFYDSECGWIEKEDVTHWMPLPEPPKEE